jgi:hypothetical protein
MPMMKNVAEWLFGRDPQLPQPARGDESVPDAQRLLSNISLEQIRGQRMALDNRRREALGNLKQLEQEREDLVRRYADARLQAHKHELLALEREFERVELGIRTTEQKHYDLNRLLQLLDCLEDRKADELWQAQHGAAEGLGLDWQQLRGVLDGVIANQKASRAQMEALLDELAAMSKDDELARNAATSAARRKLMELTDEEVSRTAEANAQALTRAAARIDPTRGGPLAGEREAT